MRVTVLDSLSAAEGLAAELDLLQQLDKASSGGADASAHEALLIWEAASPCVVLPRSGRAEDHADVGECRRREAPVLRRTSGGGAVVVGPGCINYALLLSLTARPRLASVPQSYRLLLGKLTCALGVEGVLVEERDLAFGNRKFAGHAQHRTRWSLLHHGTILCGFDLELIPALLREPPRRPAYRGGRRHREFLVNLPVAGREVKRRVASLADRLSACGLR